MRQGVECHSVESCCRVVNSLCWWVIHGTLPKILLPIFFNQWGKHEYICWETWLERWRWGGFLALIAINKCHFPEANFSHLALMLLERFTRWCWHAGRCCVSLHIPRLALKVCVHLNNSLPWLYRYLVQYYSIQMHLAVSTDAQPIGCNITQYGKTCMQSSKLSSHQHGQYFKFILSLFPQGDTFANMREELRELHKWTF